MSGDRLSSGSLWEITVKCNLLLVINRKYQISSSRVLHYYYEKWKIWRFQVSFCVTLNWYIADEQPGIIVFYLKKVVYKKSYVIVKTAAFVAFSSNLETNFKKQRQCNVHTDADQLWHQEENWKGKQLLRRPTLMTFWWHSAHNRRESFTRLLLSYLPLDDVITYQLLITSQSN